MTPLKLQAITPGGRTAICSIEKYHNSAILMIDRSNDSRLSDSSSLVHAYLDPKELRRLYDWLDSYFSDR